MLHLPPNLAELARLAGASARYATGCLLLSEQPEGYQLEATDGRRLAVVRGPGRADEPAPELAEAPAGAPTALVPAAAFAKLLKSARSGRPALTVLGPDSTTWLVGGTVDWL